MAYQVVSTKQIVLAALVAGAFTAVLTQGMNFYQAQQNLPVIEEKADGICVRVINFKNGDGFQCQDKDVVLRRYKVVVIK